MKERVVLTIEKLRDLCPACANNFEKQLLAKGITVKNVYIKKVDYDWLMMKEDGRPPKEWFDNCVASVSQNPDVDDPAAMCAYVWQNKEGDDEAAIPDTEDSLEAVKAKMKADDCVGKLKKDIDTVLCWRKFGKALNPEQQRFADRVADEMISYRVAKQSGIQLISGDNIRFIKKGIIDKGMQPTYGSDRVGPCEQDAVAGVHSKDGKFPRKTKEQTNLDKGIKGDKQPALGESAAEDGQVPKKTPDIKSIKVIPPPTEHKEGEVTNTICDEKIGHHPNEPMPKKTAEELIANAKWGVEIGAYTNVKEGIDRQLGRKEYAEFIDTDDKLKSVISYLNSLNKE